MTLLATLQSIKTKEYVQRQQRANRGKGDDGDKMGREMDVKGEDCVGCPVMTGLRAAGHLCS
jgi:hypothetical protein